MIEDFLRGKNITYSKDVSLKNKTWVKTGGVVSFWIEPNSLDKIVDLVSFLDERDLKYDVVGHTTNIYYVDGYNPNIIISTIKLNHYSINKDIIRSECGVSVTRLSRECAELGIEGFAGMVGLPGTVGAAAINNSSCFDCSISGLLIEADFYNSKTRKVEKMYYDDFHYSKRSSVLKNNRGGVLLEISLRRTQGDKEQEMKKTEYARNYRIAHHEKPALTLGSVFTARKERKDVKNIIFHTGVFVMRMFHFATLENIKNWRLWLYGYRDLNHFVSAKNVNTFIWRKDEAELYSKFMRYYAFMNEFFLNPKIEIEVRKNILQ